MPPLVCSAVAAIASMSPAARVTGARAAIAAVSACCAAIQLSLVLPPAFSRQPFGGRGRAVERRAAVRACSTRVDSRPAS